MDTSNANRTRKGLIFLLLASLATIAHGEYVGPFDDELSLSADDRSRSPDPELMTP